MSTAIKVTSLAKAEERKYRRLIAGDVTVAYSGNCTDWMRPGAVGDVDVDGGPAGIRST